MTRLAVFTLAVVLAAIRSKRPFDPPGCPITSNADSSGTLARECR